MTEDEAKVKAELAQLIADLKRDERQFKLVPTRCIGWAVGQLWSGERVRRAGWRDKWMWLVMVRGCKRRTGDGDAPVSQAEFWGLGPHILEATEGRMDEAPVQPFVVLYSGAGELAPWTCGQADLLAVDWELVSTYSTILADASDGPVTVELPAASSSTGSVHVVKKGDASANAVTVVCNAPETFDATEGHAIAAPWDAVAAHGVGPVAWCPADPAVLHADNWKCEKCGGGWTAPVDSSPQCQPNVPYVGDGWPGLRKGVVEGLEGTGQFERGSVTVEKVTGDVNAAMEKASRQAEEIRADSERGRGPDGDVLF